MFAIFALAIRALQALLMTIVTEPSISEIDLTFILDFRLIL